MNIEILYFEGCPNHEPTVALVREVLRDLELAADITEIEITDPDEAKTLKFLGSPSVRVDGADIEAAAVDRTDYGYCCRTYHGEGTPPRDMIVQALRESETAEACCADESHGVEEGGASLGMWASGASLLSAAVASACCWLPLAAAAVGTSSLGAGAYFEKARPLFLALSVFALGSGFYFAYFRNRSSSSAVRQPLKRQSLQRSVLWLSAAGVVAFAFFPLYSPSLPAQAAPPIDTPGIALLIPIEGMTCTGCATNVEGAVRGIPGVLRATASFEEGQLAVVVDEPSAALRKALVAAINKAGYTARPSALETARP